MAASGISKSASGVTIGEKREALDRVLRSKYFSNAPKKQRFLRLICEYNFNDRGKELNEYLIGREVFDRDEGYNPAIDPIVRVGAHGIREKLILYYQREGLRDPIRIDIPIGGYEAVFSRQEAIAEAGEGSGRETGRSGEGEEAIAGAAWPNGWEVRAGVLSLVIIILILAICVLWVRTRVLSRQIEQANVVAASLRSSIGLHWEPFLASKSPVLLVLSNPVVYRASNPADSEALLRQAITLTPEQFSMITNAAGNRLPLGEGKALQLVPAFNMYTGIGEAIGTYRISNLLQGSGKPTILRQSRSLSADDLKNHDVILVGSIYSNQWSKPVSVRENFIYTRRSSIENREPLPGELKEYTSEFNQQTGELTIDYALITVTHGVSSDRRLMVLAGIFSEGTEAAAEFVTDPKYLGQLNQELDRRKGEKGLPQNYQALIKVFVENSFPTKSTLIALRELQ